MISTRGWISFVLSGLLLLLAALPVSCLTTSSSRGKAGETVKQNRMTQADLDEFVACYNPENRHDRKPTWCEDNPDGRWRAYTYEEIIARDKASLDIFWLRDESLEDSANLRNPRGSGQCTRKGFP
jgi:hypothetical protein